MKYGYLLFIILILTSCGGGGGGDNSESTSTSSTPTTSVNVAPGFGNLDMIFSTSEDTNKAMGLSAPTDSNNDNLTITVITFPAKGSIATLNRLISKDDKLTTNDVINLSYSPPLNFNDADGLQGVFILRASDGKSSVDKKITIKVAPVNDVPVITASDSYSVIEGKQSVTTIAVTDIEDDTITFALGGANQSLFNIDSAGHLKFISAPSGASEYSLAVIVSDGTNQIQKDLTVDVGEWTPSELVISGKVIDGYIQNARVFIDVNFDGVWSGSADFEPSALTNNNGDYQFDSDVYNANKACYDRRPRIAVVDENAYDVSLGAITKPYKLVFMPNIEWMANSVRNSDASMHTNLTPYTSVSKYLISKAKRYLIETCTKNCDQLRRDLIAINQVALLGDQCAADSTSTKIANAISLVATQEKSWMNNILRNTGLPLVDVGNRQVISSGYDYINWNKNVIKDKSEKMVTFLTLIETLNKSLDTYFEGVYGNSGDLVGIETRMNAETVKELYTGSSFVPLSAEVLFTGEATIDGWTWKDEMTINRLKGTIDAKLTQGSCEKTSASDKCGVIDPALFSNILKSAASVELINTWQKNSSVSSDITNINYREEFNAWWGQDENCEGTCASEPDNPERVVNDSDTYHCSESSSISFNFPDNSGGNVYAIQDFDANLGCPARSDGVKRLMWNFYGNQFTYMRSDSVQEQEGEYDGIHIRLYNEGENTDIVLPVIDKTQRNPQAMIDWIPYAKTLPNHWAEINKVKNLFRVSSEGTNSDSVTFSSRRSLGGKNMMHELIISKTADGFNETCIKQDRTDYNINNENVIVERINGANAYNECFGNFTSLK